MWLLFWCEVILFRCWVLEDQEGIKIIDAFIEKFGIKFLCFHQWSARAEQLFPSILEACEVKRTISVSASQNFAIFDHSHTHFIPPQCVEFGSRFDPQSSRPVFFCIKGWEPRRGGAPALRLVFVALKAGSPGAAPRFLLHWKLGATEGRSPGAAPRFLLHWKLGDAEGWSPGAAPTFLLHWKLGAAELPLSPTFYTPVVCDAK